MYRNLRAEQARNGHTNEFVAEFLGMSRANYENKLKNGRFRIAEAKKLCGLYECVFEYLFAEDEPTYQKSA